MYTHFQDILAHRSNNKLCIFRIVIIAKTLARELLRSSVAIWEILPTQGGPHQLTRALVFVTEGRATL